MVCFPFIPRERNHERHMESLDPSAAPLLTCFSRSQPPSDQLDGLIIIIGHYFSRSIQPPSDQLDGWIIIGHVLAGAYDPQQTSWMAG